MLEHRPTIFSRGRSYARRNVQGRLRKIVRLFAISLSGTACLFMSGCPGSTQSTKTPPNGPSVQVVETTGDRSMLLQSQPSIFFCRGRKFRRPRN
jgi:hypothetical protein